MLRTPTIIWIALQLTVSAYGCSASQQADTADIPVAADATARGDTTVEVDVPASELPRLPPDRKFTSPWAAGAASRVINPDHSAVLGGYGLCEGNAAMCRYSEGVHDELTVQAAALAVPATGEVVIFVGVDSVGLLGYDIDQVHQAAPEAFAQEFGVQFEGPRIVIGASHSHAAPDTVGLYGPMDTAVREEEAYIGEIRSAILESALEAFGNLADAELTWGTGTAPNHSDDKHASDEVVYALSARTPAGEQIFTLTRWPIHPTGYSDKNNALSADYLGPFRAHLTEQLGGVAVYLNGPQGSTYADLPQPCDGSDAFPGGWQDPDLGESEHAEVSCVGTNLAKEVIAALAAGQPMTEGHLVFRHAHFEFHPTNALLAFLLADSPIPIEVGDVSDPTTMLASQFSWITVGDLDFITTPGESFPSFGLHTVALMQQHGVETPIVLGLTQDWLGYLLSQEQYGEDGLSYYRTLSPGETVEPAYLERLEQLLTAAAEETP